MNKKVPVRGFTLIEILVVIGIIAILAAVVIIAINPARQFAQARNSQRQANIESLLNAIGQNLADNKGITTCTGITTSALKIGTPASASIVDLGTCLSPYLPAGVPMDPGASDATNGPVGTAGNTQYTVKVDTTGRFTVCAPNAQYETAIAGSVALCVVR